jgi:1-acyl-sn-glycerol-3-phosphate acyltransferase
MDSAPEKPNPKNKPPIPPKPRAESIRFDITHLPKLTKPRILFRRFFRVFLRFLTWIFIDLEINGLENIPKKGAVIGVTNHLGDADALIGWALTPRDDCEVLIKAELHDFPILGAILDAYGVIWVHRGRADRPMLRAAIQGLNEGRMLGIAPEGRESLTDGLEEGTHGAAYLALKTNSPVYPITFTGTENNKIYSNIKRLRRTKATITIGKTFHLENLGNRRLSLDEGTKTIMLALAKQLPPEYQGYYADYLKQNENS